MGERVIMLKCRNCGAALRIHDDMDEIACAFCGVSQVVERVGGTLALKQVGAAIARVQAGTDRTAAELAIVRLEKEWQLEQQRLAAVESAAGYGYLPWFAAALFVVALASFRDDVFLALVLVGCGGIALYGWNQSRTNALRRGSEIRQRMSELQAELNRNRSVVGP